VWIIAFAFALGGAISFFSLCFDADKSYAA
jgi:hypothetical protein